MYMTRNIKFRLRPNLTYGQPGDVDDRIAADIPEDENHAHGERLEL